VIMSAVTRWRPIPGPSRCYPIKAYLEKSRYNMCMLQAIGVLKFVFSEICNAEVSSVQAGNKMSFLLLLLNYFFWKLMSFTSLNVTTNDKS
jgi:hypothetical protein